MTILRTGGRAGAIVTITGSDSGKERWAQGSVLVSNPDPDPTGAMWGPACMAEKKVILTADR